MRYVMYNYRFLKVILPHQSLTNALSVVNYSPIYNELLSHPLWMTAPSGMNNIGSPVMNYCLISYLSLPHPSRIIVSSFRKLFLPFHKLLPYSSCIIVPFVMKYFASLRQLYCRIPHSLLPLSIMDHIQLAHPSWIISQFLMSP